MSPPRKPPSPWLVVGGLMLMMVTPQIFDAPATFHWFDKPFHQLGALMMNLVSMGAPGFFLIGMSFLLLILAFMALASWAIRPLGLWYQRYDRWQRQRCIACDYDLRAHPSGGKCPECAAEIPPKYVPPAHDLVPPTPPRFRWPLTFLLLSLAGLAAVIMFDRHNRFLPDFLRRVDSADVAFDLTMAYIFILLPWLSRYSRHRLWRLHKCTRCTQPLPAEPAPTCPNCGTFCLAPSR